MDEKIRQKIVENDKKRQEKRMKEAKKENCKLVFFSDFHMLQVNGYGEDERGFVAECTTPLPNKVTFFNKYDTHTRKTVGVFSKGKKDWADNLISSKEYQLYYQMEKKRLFFEILKTFGNNEIGVFVKNKNMLEDENIFDVENGPFEKTFLSGCSEKKFDKALELVRKKKGNYLLFVEKNMDLGITLKNPFFDFADRLENYLTTLSIAVKN